MDVEMLMADQLSMGINNLHYTTAMAGDAAHHGHVHGVGGCGAGPGVGMGGNGGGNGFDFDQWLQFPAEGGGGLGVGSDDAFMGGMFAERDLGGMELKGADGLAGVDWLGIDGLGH
jgi:hypothetical protein